MNNRSAARLARAPELSTPAWGDLIVFSLVAAALYGGIALGHQAGNAAYDPEVAFTRGVLPAYALKSVGRMAAAYVLSLGFTLAYGYVAARNKTAERVLVPLLDVLQSVPILSFLPLVLLSLAAVLPEPVAVELAAIVLLFTSQVWNLTFSWYQSLRTVPVELREAAASFQMRGWLRFRAIELPYAAIGLVWNSMMSWAGGWFFLMAAESFTVGQRDFRLPGLGSYLHAAAAAGDLEAIVLGIFTLVAVIVALDQLAWRPLIAWSYRFKLEAVGGQPLPTSWFLEALRSSHALRWARAAFAPAAERVDTWLVRISGHERARRGSQARIVAGIVLVGLLGIALYEAARALLVLSTVSWQGWLAIAVGLLATLARVAAALGLAALWTIPLGVAIGTNRKLASLLQPIAQIAASVPATALFPVVLLVFLRLPFGLNLSAVALMLMGTQWYLLFNVIAGTAAIPEDLRHTSQLMGLSGLDKWRTLILPAIFPQAITGAITATGGAWNASIVAEYIQFAGETRATVGIGALISEATANGDFALLLAATLAMIAAVVLLNRLLWRRLYRLAEERYRME